MVAEPLEKGLGEDIEKGKAGARSLGSLDLVRLSREMGLGTPLTPLQ